MDHSDAIDKQEAIEHWNNKFGKLSAAEFFKQIDVNNDGKIEFDEFKTFWEVVAAAGHTEEEIMDELDKVEKGESWVGFNDLPGKYRLN